MHGLAQPIGLIRFNTIEPKVLRGNTDARAAGECGAAMQVSQGLIINRRRV